METFERWTPEVVLHGLNPPVLVDKDANYWWVVSGGKRFVAPKNVTLDMIRTHWVRWRPSSYKPDAGIISYKIKSSSGKGFYTITVTNGIKSCDCPGFSYRRKCKHISCNFV